MTAKKRVKYKITTKNGRQTIALAIDGEPYQTDDSDKNWEKIVAGAKADDASIVNLLEPAVAAKAEFDKVKEFNQDLSDRLSVRGRSITWDGDVVHSALGEQILRFLDEGLDFKPLVKFYDKISQNPSKNSQAQLYDFLKTHNFVITDDGDIMAYKGYTDRGGGTYVSTTAGHAFVNGVEFGKGQRVNIPCKIGDVVTMPRSECVDNPHSACAAGLHIGTYSFAKTFGRRMAVLINPRDIVSVPTREAQKMRCCRYVVLEEADSEHVSALKKMAPSWKPTAPVPTEELVKEEAAGLDEPVPEQPKSSVLADEPETKRPKRGSVQRKTTITRKTAAKTTKTTKAEPKNTGKGVSKPVSREEKARTAASAQPTQIDWSDPKVRKKLRATNSAQERREAFPGVSDSTLRKRYAELFK